MAVPLKNVIVNPLNSSIFFNMVGYLCFFLIWSHELFFIFLGDLLFLKYVPFETTTNVLTICAARFMIIELLRQCARRACCLVV